MVSVFGNLRPLRTTRHTRVSASMSLVDRGEVYDGASAFVNSFICILSRWSDATEVS